MCARGGNGAVRDAAPASDIGWVTMRPQARWMLGSSAVYVDLAATAEVEGTDPLAVAASPRLDRPAAADLRLVQPVIVMKRGPSMANVSKGGGGGGNTGVTPQVHVTNNISGCCGGCGGGIRAR